MHGSALQITSNTKGFELSNCDGDDCVEIDYLALSLSPTGKRMTATITKITYARGKVSVTGKVLGKAIPNPEPAESDAVGDSFSLRFVAPQLMKSTTTRTSEPVIDQGGNPYWCGDHIAPALEGLCGA